LTDKTPPTRERHGDKTKLEILKSGKKEFLSQGFQGASLRTIAKNAGLTTGAVYTHFKDKSHLFETLVAPVMDGFASLFAKSPTEYFDIHEDDGDYRIPKLSTEKRKDLIAFIYEHFDEFKLLTQGAQGFDIKGFIKFLTDIKVKSLTEYLGDVTKSGHIGKGLDPALLPALVSGYYWSVFEAVATDMDQERAEKYVEKVASFYNAGWLEILTHAEKRP
jgi:AcrR family transcriptional regulator